MIFRDKIIIYSEAGALPESAFRELVNKAGELDMDEVRKQVADQQQTDQA
jgi:thioredoxin 1